MSETQENSVAMSARPVALVLGATGGVGGAVAAKLLAKGYTVRAMHRNAGAQAAKAPQYEWIAGDAINRADVVAAARGAELIVHAVNPPGYRNWGTLVLPMIDNTIAAAEAAGALILMPGTVYNFGPETFDSITEESPQRPVTVKGKIRVELEQRLEAAARRGTRVIIVRAGDFFGPGAGNNWFAQAVVKPGRPVKAITIPSDRGVGHQWAYLPDVAETMMQLLARAENCRRSRGFTWKGSGTMTANSWRTRSAAPPENRSCGRNGLRGGCCILPGRSCLLRANSWRCATCGRENCICGMTGWWRFWELSRTRPSTGPCGIR
jgi:NAD dependent epimerase/dehydratase family enzyme